VASFATGTTDVVDTSGKFATGVNDTGNIRLQTPSSELEGKIYINVNSATQRCQDKIIKNFLIEDFFHLPLVSATPVVHLELQISPRIFEKIRSGPYTQWLGGN
jgi:hypothetical protein